MDDYDTGSDYHQSLRDHHCEHRLTRHFLKNCLLSELNSAITRGIADLFSQALDS